VDEMQMVPPRLTVIVISWNTRDLLARCLEAVWRDGAALAPEVIVVDNASTDGSAELVANRFPEARLVRNPDNRGFGRACNQALAIASGESILFLNPDAEPCVGALTRLVEFLEARRDVGAVGPLLLTASGEPGLTYGYFPSIATALLPLLRPLARLLQHPSDLHALGVIPAKLPSDAPVRDVDYLCGAALVVRRDLLVRIGGFDERFFLYFEETDLCRRIHAAGLRVVLLPAARALHREGGSREKRGGPALQDYYRSLNLYLRKHHGDAYVALVRASLLLALAARYVAARAMLETGVADYYRASLRALREGAHA
jgi:GT2 family glycosyltransferase